MNSNYSKKDVVKAISSNPENVIEDEYKRIYVPISEKNTDELLINSGEVDSQKLLFHCIIYLPNSSLIFPNDGEKITIKRYNTQKEMGQITIMYYTQKILPKIRTCSVVVLYEPK